MRLKFLLTLLLFGTCFFSGQHWCHAASSPPSVKQPDNTSVKQVWPIALVVSGGVSLGSYEGGLLFYELGMLRQYADMLQFKAAGGASAGSLNSLLSILTFCGPIAKLPEDSLFYSSWIPLGLKQLFQREKSSSIGLFTREAFEAASINIQKYWDRGVDPSCDAVWGVSTTRVYPRSISFANDRLHLPRTEEKFSVHIRGQEGISPAVALNYTDENYALEQTMIAEDTSGKIPFQRLQDLTFASCSFPIAFRPKTLSYCIVPGDAIGPKHCTSEKSIDGLFIDGGIFDNTPLRLTARLMGAGLIAQNDGQYRWAQNPDLDQFSVPSNARFLFVTPDATTYPVYDESSEEIAPDSLIKMVEQLMATFVSTSRTKELYTVLEEQPDLRNKIYVPRRHFPTLSGLLYAFFGFVEKDFRIFDFYLGMYDARHSFFEEIEPQLVKVVGATHATAIYPEQAKHTTWEESRQWSFLRCMRQVYDSTAPDVDACKEEHLANFRILIQVSLERLYDNCARLEAKAIESTTNQSCRAGGRGESPPKVKGVAVPKNFNWRRAAYESEFDYVLRLLAAHEFEFKDLGLSSNYSRQAPALVREQIQHMASAIASRQALSQRHAIRMGGELLADAIVDAPPKHTFYLSLSRHVELGHSGASHLQHILPHWLRPKIGVLLGGIGDLVSSQGGYFSIGPIIGTEFYPHHLHSPLVKGRLSLAASFLFSASDSFSSASCSNASRERFNSCSRMVLQAQTGIIVFDYLRFHLGADVYPDVWGGRKTLWSLAPGFGVQF